MSNEFGRGDAPTETRAEGLSDEEFSALMRKVDAFAPLLRGFFAPPAGGAPDKGESGATRPDGRENGRRANREALLRALKPYLSPERGAAVDYLIRLARIGDAIRALR